jgi:S1-C subfamily serine protease
VSRPGRGQTCRRGVIVVARAADSNIDTSLAAGDVIHTINGAPVATMETLRAVLDQMKANSPVVLQIERGGKLMFVSIQLD